MVSDRVTLSGQHAPRSIQNSERGVQPVEHAEILKRLDRVDWNDLHLLGGVAGATSLRKAAQELGVSVNTVRARLSRLESTLDTTLFARTRDGLRVTAEGRSVITVAKEMRALSTGLSYSRGNNILVRDGEIRICASEGIGTFWLTPRLSELRQCVPDLAVTLHNDFDQSRIHSRDFDLSLGFVRPTDPDMVVSKLATLHFMLFASEGYLRERGMPQSLDDIGGHDYVEQEAPGLRPESVRLFVGQEGQERLTAVRVNTSFSLYWAVANGAGIAALPTYMRAVSRRVRPLDLPLRMKFELWMAYDESARVSQPVRQTVDWLRSCFDSARYPWFSDHFVHPDDFIAPFHDSQVVPLFDHIIDDPV
jgi:DNA-binding transcriptional LysR family regulator